MHQDRMSNNKKTTTSIGEKLLSILGKGTSKEFSQSEKAQVLALLKCTKALVEQYRETKGYKFKLQPNDLVCSIYPRLRFGTAKETEKTESGLTQCCEELLGWCITQMEDGQPISRKLLLNLTLDLSCARFLGTNFHQRAFRTMSWIPRDTFKQSKRWFLDDVPPDRLVSEFMIIFELRQTLEVAIRRIIGFESVDAPLKLKHETTWNILKNRIGKKNFSPPGKLGLDKIKHIYDWTEPSIHMMQSDYTFIIWKAITIVDSFFFPTQRKNGQWSIYDNFEISTDLLSQMQNDLITELKKLATKIGVTRFTITWVNPDAAIVDKSGRAVRLKKRYETIVLSPSLTAPIP